MSGVRGARGVSPYSGLPADRFWKSGVVQQDPRFAALYSKKYDIAPTAKIATAGSCFAQHVTRWLKTHGLNFLDLEPAPSRLSIKMSERFQYGVYSCRYGNLYTPAQLLQLAQEALLDRDLSGVAVWKREDGRFVDAFRPAVDPDAFDTAEETLLHRRLHLAAVKRMFKSADVFVFTLGLTEAWLSADGAVVYPTAPGTLAGVYDPGAYKFHNYSVTETMAAMRGAIDLIRSVNPGCRVFADGVARAADGDRGGAAHPVVDGLFQSCVARGRGRTGGGGCWRGLFSVLRIDHQRRRAQRVLQFRSAHSAAGGCEQRHEHVRRSAFPGPR